MPTPRVGETRDQMRERMRQAKLLDKIAPRIVLPRPAIIDFARGRWSPATRVAYENNWTDFAKFCKATDVPTLPAAPETVATFIRARADTHSTSAISQRLAAIRAVHKDAKGQLAKTDTKRELYTLDDPIIADAWKEVCRDKGTAGTPKGALTKKELRKMLSLVPPPPLMHGVVMAFAYWSAMRRSEIVALDRRDLEFDDKAVTVTIRRSKTDKTGKGQTVAIPRVEGILCAVTMLEELLEGIDRGPVFRARNGSRMLPEKVALITKRWAKAIGLDPKDYGAHSWRHGCITDMNRAGVGLSDGMVHTRHSTSSIYLGYVEKETAAKNPAIHALAAL